jgi:hypothetical protein
VTAILLSLAKARRIHEQRIAKDLLLDKATIEIKTNRLIAI